MKSLQFSFLKLNENSNYESTELRHCNTWSLLVDSILLFVYLFIYLFILVFFFFKNLWNVTNLLIIWFFYFLLWCLCHAKTHSQNQRTLFDVTCDTSKNLQPHYHSTWVSLHLLFIFFHLWRNAIVFRKSNKSRWVRPPS